MRDLDLGSAFEAHGSFVWRSLRRLGVRSADVEDATQEVFIVAHRRRDAFEWRCQLRTWLFGICRRVAADYRRKAWVMRELPVATLPVRAVRQEGPLNVAISQARAELERMLGELDEAKRSTFVLFELEELPMHEVAELTGVPLQTAYARLYAARRQLEKLIARAQGRHALTLIEGGLAA